MFVQANVESETDLMASPMYQVRQRFLGAASLNIIQVHILMYKKCSIFQNTIRSLGAKMARN